MEVDFLLRALAPSLFIGSLSGLILPVLIYALARWRANRDPVPDPQLGLKVALGFFAMVGLQLALLGATLLVYAMLASGEDKGTKYRDAFGLIMPALIVFGVHFALLKRTNQDLFPGVRRLFLGISTCITGAISVVGLVLAFEALFKKGSSGEEGRIAGAIVLVYGSAWVVLGVQLGKLVLGGSFYSGPLGGPPDHVVPPPAQPPTPSQPALPKLGGGAYPPIEPK